MTERAEFAPTSFGAGRSVLAGLRAALACGVGAVILVGLVDQAVAAARRAVPIRDVPVITRPADARKAKQNSAQANRKKQDTASKQPFGDVPKGPLQMVVSITHQRVTLYSNGVRVAQAQVSTGTASHPTPAGVFSIIQKDRFHRSNLYGNAPMFYMQRLTWSGVAMHEGVLPGVPASHGCIRLPHEFASRLWVVTRLGVRVIVSRGDVAPVDFHHAGLFVPKAKPAEQPVAGNEIGKRADIEQLIQVAEAPAAIRSDAVRVAWATGISANSAKPAGTPAVAEPAKPAEATPPEEPRVPPVTTKPAELAPMAPAAAETKPATLPPLRGTATDEIAKPAEVETTATTPPTEAPKAGAAPVPTAATVAAEPAASTSNDLAKPAADDSDLFSKPAPLKTRADDLQKRTGHVSVFVSRKEKKIFVRHGFLPLFDMPVEIVKPDQAWGTHVFTALEIKDDGASLRWNLLSMPPELPRAATSPAKNAKNGSKRPPKPVVEAKPQHQLTAAEALDHIKIPQGAYDRIGEILGPGSSLVISDYGLGTETGRYTDFIVLTR